VADAVFEEGLRPLPFSRAEAEAILAFAPADKRWGALGPAASRDAVLGGGLGRYRIVHFATHGLIDTEHPERSGIALSGGFLEASEIYGLDLPADLVVLSACRTALGRNFRGEGLIGLTRAFQSAGARSVLVSLWEVEDRATAELMRRFYREMLVAGRPPAAALRAAQASLRGEPGWRSPYFWAGFVLQGDWR
jgi:CHAT domain-containing protein